MQATQGVSLRFCWMHTTLFADSVHILHSHEAKRTKNISTDEFGAKVGRIHMDKQDYGKMNVKKMKALRPAAAPATEEEA